METNFAVLVVLRSAGCMLSFVDDASEDQVICESCFKLQKKMDTLHGRKRLQNRAPDKDKAFLSACGLEKLRTTLKAERLRCKELEPKVKNLQGQMKKHGLSI